ncbi:MAG: hypothetical protein GX194_08750 [Clostridium sp.]|nr:hypothetical protein [Clostridium sp.]
MKRFSPVLFMLLPILIASSCVIESTTQKYLDSYKNTMNAQSLQSRIEGQIGIDLSNASARQKELFGGFENVTFNIDEAVDRRNKLGESNFYISIGDRIINTKIFVQDDIVYMRFPDLDSEKRYIKLDLDKENFAQSLDKDHMDEYAKVKDEIKRIWTESVKDEIIANEGNSFESTPEGDIKVNQLSLELTDQKAKNILDNIFNIISQNEAIKKFSNEMAIRFFDGDVSEEETKEVVEGFFDKLADFNEEINDSFTINKLKLTAKIDKDMYIIDEMLEGELIIKDGTEGEAVLSFEINTTRWDIDRDIKIDIPKINENEIISGDEADDFLNDFFMKIKGDKK